MTSNEFKEAYNTALRSLNYSEKSSYDLRQKLVLKHYSDTTIEQVITKMEEIGFVNDVRFAEQLRDSWVIYKKAGRHKLAFELKKHGIHSEIQNRILNELSDSLEEENAWELAESKSRHFNDISPHKNRKKLYDFLIRKGYDVGLSRRVCESFFNENRED